MVRLLLALAILPAAVMADAGYLGSVAQGPVPLSRESTSVSLVCEDVLIQVGRGTYELSGGFLFSAIEAETVYMYFPVDVLTPFVSALYSSLDPGFQLERVSVSVDGSPVEVFPLFVVEWEPESVAPLTWERVMELTEPLNEEEPRAGGPLYITRMPSMAELRGSGDGFDDAYPAFHVQALNACWQVDFDSGDTVLVEYTVSGDLTMDYDATESILCYPLQTGSTWAGAIEQGRVSVVPVAGEGLERMTFAAGVMLPPGSTAEPFTYEPLAQLATRPGFAATSLARSAGTVFQGALIWSFSDFEPSLAPTGWRALHPGLGDMYGIIADSVTQWRHGELERKPTGWSGSYIYLYMSEGRPDGLTVIAVEGLPLLESPALDSRKLVMLPVTTWLEPLRWREGWVEVRARVPECLGGEDAGEYTGWVRLDRTGPDGLAPPLVLPML